MTHATARKHVPVTRNRYQLFSCHVFKGLIKGKAQYLKKQDRRRTKMLQLRTRITDLSDRLAYCLVDALDEHPDASAELDYYVLHAVKSLVADDADELLDDDLSVAMLNRKFGRLVRIAIWLSEPMLKYVNEVATPGP